MRVSFLVPVFNEEATIGEVLDRIAALNLDAHGKTLSFLLLSLEIQVPTEIATVLLPPNPGVTPCSPP